MTGKVLSSSTQMYVSKAFLPHGRRPHVKQLCARTCPVLPVQRELCKNISSSDRYHFVQKHPQGYYKKKDSTDVSATPVSRKVLSCISIDMQEVHDHSLYNDLLLILILILYQSQAPFHAFLPNSIFAEMVLKMPNNL